MKEAAVFYDLETGEPNGGWVPDIDAFGTLTPPDGMGMLRVPYGAVSPEGVVDLEKARAKACQQIDAEAEAMRLAFITPGAGQAMTYQYKAEEAKALLNDPDAETPFLSAEAEATGTTVAALAEVVRGQVQAWTFMGAAIEAGRMKAKAEMAEAGPPGAIAAAAVVDWQALALS